jgi:ATP-binding cassette, subfamily F, member 3
LARALMCPSDLLLLDEPTNHLDLDALVWLEAWLKKYPGTMLVISHDREFLDAVTNVTIHIENGQLTRYGGNYSTFEDMRAEQMALQQAAFAKQQDKIAHLQKFIDRFKAKASKAKQAQSRVKALDRMERLAPLLATADFTFEFKEPQSLPNPMLTIDDASFGYPPPADAPAGTSPTVIVKHVSKSVFAGQRIGILGANGQGKSTLVKTIARTLPVVAGAVTEGKGLNIGYFAQQELDVLRPLDTPLEHMIRLARDTIANGGAGQFSSREQDLRTFLGTFNFNGDMVKQAVGTMSGGEKARLVLCMIVWQRPNLLAAGRADQPPRSRHPRSAGDGPERIRRHRDAGQPRPCPAAIRVRRVLDGHARRGRTVRRRSGRLPALSAGRGQAPARKPEGGRQSRQKQPSSASAPEAC